MTDSVFLALGANLGAREATLAAAREALARRGVRVVRSSGLYLTEPVGGPAQDWYVNQVVQAETALEPAALLETALAIEQAHGRERSVPTRLARSTSTSCSTRTVSLRSPA